MNLSPDSLKRSYIRNGTPQSNNKRYELQAAHQVSGCLNGILRSGEQQISRGKRDLWPI
jgi:hypothetical protein